MDIVILLQIVFIFLIFVLTFLCVLLPLKIIPQDPTKTQGAKSKRIISFCNCFSGGVFLGTCFLQLVPFIEEKFNVVFQKAGVDAGFAPCVTQLTVMLGFFLILVIEQMVRVCQQKQVSKEEVQEMIKMPNDYMITSSENDTGSEDSEEEIYSEKQNMLKKNAKKISNGQAKILIETDGKGAIQKHIRIQKPVNAGVAEPAHGHTHGGGCHGHGHSHLVDIVKEDFGLRCLLLLFALSIHSLFEGMALGLQTELFKTVTLFIGIAVHEILVAFAIGVNLAQQGLRIITVIKLCLIFSLTIPVGIAIGMGLNGIQTLTGHVISAIVQGLTAGTFVYVTFLEILPSEINGNSDKLLKVLFMFLGFVVITCLRFSVHGGNGFAVRG